MSDFFESARSPGVIGVLLGLVALAGFGGLSIAVFDGRFNGENATALKEEVRAQSLEIFSLEDDIERAERELVNQKHNEVTGKKLATASKTLNILEKKKESLSAEIEESRKAIARVKEEQLAYRDEYRAYERKRALGESFPTVTLTTGKELKNAKIREIQTSKVRFTTEFGGTSATWEELPQTWRDRFQIGEGELEQHAKLIEEEQKKRAKAAATIRTQRGTQLREMELVKSISRVGNSILSKKKEMENARAKVTILRNKARAYRSKETKSRVRGSISSHGNSAEKAEAQAAHLEAGVRLASDRIDELVKEKARLEGELLRLRARK